MYYIYTLYYIIFQTYVINFITNHIILNNIKLNYIVFCCSILSHIRVYLLVVYYIIYQILSNYTILFCTILDYILLYHIIYIKLNYIILYLSIYSQIHMCTWYISADPACSRGSASEEKLPIARGKKHSSPVSASPFGTGEPTVLEARLLHSELVSCSFRRLASGNFELVSCQFRKQR